MASLRVNESFSCAIAKLLNNHLRFFSFGFVFFCLRWFGYFIHYIIIGYSGEYQFIDIICKRFVEFSIVYTLRLHIQTISFCGFIHSFRLKQSVLNRVQHISSKFSLFCVRIKPFFRYSIIECLTMTCSINFIVQEAELERVN